MRSCHHCFVFRFNIYTYIYHLNILVLYSYYCCIKLSCRYNIPPDLIHLYFNCNIFPSHIILLFIWAHKTSLTLPLVIDVLLQRRVWRYQRGNQNPYIEEEQTTQWPREKAQKGKQWSTKHTHKSKDRLTRTPLKQGWNQELRKGKQFLLH